MATKPTTRNKDYDDYDDDERHATHRKETIQHNKVYNQRQEDHAYEMTINTDRIRGRKKE